MMISSKIISKNNNFLISHHFLLIVQKIHSGYYFRIRISYLKLMTKNLPSLKL